MFGAVKAKLRLVLGRGVHLGDLTAVLADSYSGRPAVDDPAPTPGLHPGGVRTFAELEEAVARLAGALERLEVSTGPVMVATSNRIDMVLYLLALARLGLLPVPVNARLKRHEVDEIAASTGAVGAIVDARPGQSRPTGLEDVERPQLPDRLDVVTVGEIADQLEADPDARVEAAGRDPDDVVLLMTTSGTTGTPKAASLTSRGLLGGVGLLLAAPVGRTAGLRAGRDVLLASLPIAHVMGLSTALATWTAGIKLVRRHRFDAAETLDLIESEQPNVVVAVPTMYADLEANGAAQRDLSSVQLWVSAADVMPLDRARRFQSYGAAGRIVGRTVGSAAFVDIYGMVELSGPAALRLLPPPVGSFPTPAIAKTLPGFEVRAVDDHGRRVSAGRSGELQFRGPGVLKGYRRPDGHGPDDDGWLATGDHGRAFPGGLFQLSGRGRDRFKVGGFSVFPAEVEHELREAPGVRDVAVVGLPDDRLGERPVALVVPDPGFDADDFLAWARENVAGYRRPREVLTVDRLPLGNNHKIDRDAATSLATDALT